MMEENKSIGRIVSDWFTDHLEIRAQKTIEMGMGAIVWNNEALANKIDEEIAKKYQRTKG